MKRSLVHTFLWVFILVYVCACGPAPEGLPAEKTAPPATAPEPALPTFEMVPERNVTAYTTWRETKVLTDPETGCEYLMSPSGDLTPRMQGMPPTGAGFAEYQRGCVR